MYKGHLGKVMAAALESLKMTLSEGSDASFLEGIIDPEEIGLNDIQELEDRISGRGPERLVIVVEDGLVEKVLANKSIMAPTEVYILNKDVEDASDEDMEVFEFSTQGEIREVEGSLSREAIQVTKELDIDDTVNRMYADVIAGRMHKGTK